MRRIAACVDPTLAVRITPVRVPRNQIVQPHVLNSWVQRSAFSASASPHHALLVLIDSDDDCPAKLGPALLKHAAQGRSDLLLAVVLAKQEFEAWFLAAAESLAGQRSLPTPLAPPADPEGLRGAKEWLSRQMPTNRRYSPTVDQPALAALFDMAVARMRSDSFDKCYREIERLVKALAGRPELPGP